jgi:hypothetical protein
LVLRRLEGVEVAVDDEAGEVDFGSARFEGQHGCHQHYRNMIGVSDEVWKCGRGWAVGVKR